MSEKRIITFQRQWTVEIEGEGADWASVTREKYIAQGKLEDELDTIVATMIGEGDTLTDLSDIVAIVRKVER